MIFVIGIVLGSPNRALKIGPGGVISCVTYGLAAKQLLSASVFRRLFTGESVIPLSVVFAFGVLPTAESASL